MDTILWVIGTIAEAAVVGLLIYRRVYRTFPVFFVYGVWTLAGSLSAYLGMHYFRDHYTTVYIIEMIVDSALLFGVLIELTWSILRPLRPSFPRKVLFGIGCLILLAGAAIWPFAAFQATASLAGGLRFLTRLQHTFSILRVVVFLALAASSQLLAIGWRNRELQIATGLGFTSLVSLCVTILREHQTAYTQIRNWNELVVASYVCSLLYWVFSFAQQEEQRREFSPRVQSMLLAMAGSARTTRMGMEEVPAPRPRKHGRL